MFCFIVVILVVLEVSISSSCRTIGLIIICVLLRIWDIIYNLVSEFVFFRVCLFIGGLGRFIGMVGWWSFVFLLCVW